MQLETAYDLAVALGIGLLIGLERGWVARNEAEGGRAFGMRTLALSGLLGGVWGALAKSAGIGGVLALGLAFAAFAFVAAAFRLRENAHDASFGATTLLAALLAFALGALAVVGDTASAAAAGVAVTGLLASKAALHGWLQRLTFEELRAGLLLLAMTVVMLPLLHDQGYGPYGTINPRELWLMTSLLATLSAVGYVAVKAGGRHGIALSGIAGGLASSTATTLAYSRMARDLPSRSGPLIAGAVLAGSTMMVRIVVVVSVANPALVAYVAAPLLLAALASAAYGFWLVGRPGTTVGDPEEETAIGLSSPFDLAEVLKLAGVLALVMVGTGIAVQVAGGAGLLVLSALSGIADVDAITVFAAKAAGGPVTAATAAAAILVAAAVNTLAKCAIVFGVGGAEPGRRYAIAVAIAVIAAAAGVALMPMLSAAFPGSAAR